MTSEELKALRKRLGLSQRQLKDLIDKALDKRWSEKSDVVGGWERGRKPVPADVVVFLNRLELEQTFPLDEERPTLEGAHYGPDDSPPPPPPGQPDQPSSTLPVLGGGLYATICEDLWEMGATACGTLGAFSGNKKLLADRDTILANKKDLGKSWGRLAEVNPTFRKMITGGPTHAAVYIQLVLVTGRTANQLIDNHRRPPDIGYEARQPEPEPQPEPEGVTLHGDGAVVNFPG